LGNGFSMAYDERRFSFTSLLQSAVDSGIIKKEDKIFKVFERLGLEKETVIVLASGGSFTDDYSHEFQTICKTGEDTLFYVKSKNIYYNKEVAPSKAPPVKYKDTKILPRQDVLGKGIIGVEELANFLNIAPILIGSLSCWAARK